MNYPSAPITVLVHSAEDGELLVTVNAQRVAFNERGPFDPVVVVYNGETFDLEINESGDFSNDEKGEFITIVVGAEGDNARFLKEVIVCLVKEVF